MSKERQGEARVVLVTHPRQGAQAFARGLVERRLAACVNLVPATSVYRWEGELQEDEEVLLVVKSSASRLGALEGHLAAAHPYDVPECVALEPREVAAGYLGWWMGEVGS